MKNIIYTDAGYCRTKQQQQRKTGIIAYKINQNETEMFEWSVKEIQGLQQYSNLFELLAALLALVEANRLELKDVLLKTDSQVCMYWLKRKKNNLRKFSEQHFKFKELTDILIKKIGVKIQQISRDFNEAGWKIEQQYNL